MLKQVPISQIKANPIAIVGIKTSIIDDDLDKLYVVASAFVYKKKNQTCNIFSNKKKKK